MDVVPQHRRGGGPSLRLNWVGRGVAAMMSLHKLTAGDGYMYLIRQVAAADDTARGRGALGDYYSSKGETPGRWMGSGLAALSDGRGVAASAGVALRRDAVLASHPQGADPGPLRRDRKSPKRR